MGPILLLLQGSSAGPAPTPPTTGGRTRRWFDQHAKNSAEDLPPAELAAEPAEEARPAAAQHSVDAVAVVAVEVAAHAVASFACEAVTTVAVDADLDASAAAVSCRTLTADISLYSTSSCSFSSDGMSPLDVVTASEDTADLKARRPVSEEEALVLLRHLKK